MKKILLASLLVLWIIVAKTYTNTRFFSFGGVQIAKVIYLEDNMFYEFEKGTRDISYIYQSVSFFYIPIWNYNGRLVRSNPTGRILYNEKTYTLVPERHLEGFRYFFHLEKPYLNLWTWFGGKFLIVFTLVLIFLKKRINYKAKLKFISVLPTAPERLEEIIINTEKFTLSDLPNRKQIKGLTFYATRTSFMSFITISIFDMNKVSFDEFMSMKTDYVNELINTKEDLSPRFKQSTHYLYFFFYKTPNEDQILQLKALEIGKSCSAIRLIPCIINLERQIIEARKQVIPPKKVLMNSFILGKKPITFINSQN